MKAWRTSGRVGRVAMATLATLVLCAGAEPRVFIPDGGFEEETPLTPTKPLRAPLSLEPTAIVEPKVWIGLGERVAAWASPAPPEAVRVGLTASGVCRLSAADLAAAFGETEQTVSGWLEGGLLDLGCRGETVAWWGDGSALYFYGEAPDSGFIPENVYWLRHRPGLRMADRPEGERAPGATNATFTAQAVLRDVSVHDSTAFTSLTNGPFFTSANLPSTGLMRSWLQPLPHADLTSGQLTADIQLLSQFSNLSAPFRAEIVLAGSLASTNTMQSQELATFTRAVAMTNLTAASLAITVRNLNTVNDAQKMPFYFVGSTVSYPRGYAADGGMLLCTGGEAPWAEVTGLTAAPVSVWDITDPRRPAVVTNVELSATGDGTFAAVFACGGATNRYAVCAADAAFLRPSLRGVPATDWEAAATQAEHVILIPPEGWFGPHRHRALLQPLADFRTGRGLRSTVIDVEQVYNRFSDGLADPWAIQRFVRFAATNWSAAPIRYLLLVGHANFDYTLKARPFETMTHTASMIPCIALGQAYPTAGLALVAAGDMLFGDVAGTPAPEVAVGRLPFTTTNAIAHAVSKMIAYERGAFYNRRAVTAADWHNTGDKYVNFSATVTNMTAAFSRAGRDTAFLNVPPGYPSGLTTVQWESLIHPPLRAGAGVFYTIGHGGEGSVGASGGYAVIARDRTTASTWGDPVIAFLFAYRVNRWQTSNPNSTLGSKGLGLSSGGFAAAVGPSGYAGIDETLALNARLAEVLERSRPLRLGDWVAAAMAALPPGALSEMLPLSIAGDPALLLRAPKQFILMVR